MHVSSTFLQPSISLMIMMDEMSNIEVLDSGLARFGALQQCVLAPTLFLSI